MGASRGFTFEIDAGLCDGDLVWVNATTPRGAIVQIYAQVAFSGRMRVLRAPSVYGVNVARGEVGWAVLRQAVYAAMEEFDVDCIRIEEARRHSGAGPGRAVEPIEFRRRTR